MLTLSKCSKIPHALGPITALGLEAKGKGTPSRAHMKQDEIPSHDTHISKSLTAISTILTSSCLHGQLLGAPAPSKGAMGPLWPTFLG